MFKSGLHPLAYLALAPKIVALIAECIAAAKDHRLDAAEVKRIGEDFVSLVVDAYHASETK